MPVPTISLPQSNLMRCLWLAQLVLLLGGLAVIAKPVYRQVKRAWLRQVATSTWEARVRTAPEVGHSGEPIAWLNSPSIGLNTPVLFGASAQNLQAMPCLSERGVLPGKHGTMLVQAHRDRDFQNLNQMQTGDFVQLETYSGKKHRFTAVETEVIPRERLEKRFDGQFDGLVLITCHPFDFIGPAPNRYLIWLRRE